MLSVTCVALLAGCGGASAERFETISIPVGSFEVVGDDDRRERVNYEIGGCEGELRPVDVDESPDAVVIRLSSTRDVNADCEDWLALREADVDLDDPVDGRELVDGNRGRQPPFPGGG